MKGVNMGRESADREHLRTFRRHADGPLPDGEQVHVYANARSVTQPTPREYISDAEIAQLVSVALEDAIAALSEPDPENCIRLRAYDARVGIREMLSALPLEKSRDPNVLREYRRAIMFQNMTVDLALSLAASIRRYSKVYEREIPLRTP